MSRVVGQRAVCGFVLLLAVFVDRASAQEPRYYATLYGSSAGPLRFGKTHTWANYVKVTPTATGLIVEPVTISWLPADGDVNTFRPFRREPGVNLTHAETVRRVAADGARIASFGPFEIDVNRYHAAQSQVARLQSGAVAYLAVDSVGRNPSVSNCVHAVTGADPVLAGERQPWYRIGIRGTRQIAGQYTTGLRR